MRDAMLERVRARMREEDVEVLAVTEDMNVEYLFDIHPPGTDGFSGIVVVTQDDWRLYASKFFRYSLESISNVSIYRDREELQDLVADGPLEDGCHADDPDRFSELDLERSGIVQECRKVKQPAEVERMRRASDTTSQVFDELLDWFEPEVTEWDIVEQVDAGFRRRSLFNAFETLAHASTLEPHRLPRDADIEEGETLLVDMGCRFKGYCSDMTRMVPNELDGDRMELVEALGDIQRRLLDRVEAGRQVSALAGFAEDLVDEQGYSVDKHYLHSLGHGVGLSVHEPPALVPSSDATLEEGVVVTVEPGLYVPEVGGVRIEDQVVVREDGFERLTTQKRIYER
ncbi:MAG: Xaa-Pro peptidase family protein [Candidatus Nanohaloarchaea archaeon]|nr:Xaa-Pro peptidase family protein [Candidatus Nanohaloarchaea archaeon]